MVDSRAMTTKRGMSLQRLFAIVRDHLGVNVSAIDARVTRRLFRKGASVLNCDGTCCRGGATVSADEAEKILANAHLVAPEMTSRARHDTRRWFSRRSSKDHDFTSGRTVDTRVLGRRCVFLRDDNWCALQVAGQRHLGHPWALKPTVCLLWPLAIQDHKLEVGYAWFTNRKQCCSPCRSGGRTILQVSEPDSRLFAKMARPGCSRGGGPSTCG